MATGGDDFRLKHVQRQYRDRRRRLVDALRQRGLAYPFPWQDLSQWYGYWTGNDLSTYEQRRVTIRGLVAPTVAALEQQRSGLTVTDPGGGPLTWAALDARLTGLVTDSTARSVATISKTSGGGRARSSSSVPSFSPTRPRASRSARPEGRGCEGLARSVPRRPCVRDQPGRASPPRPSGMGRGPDGHPRRSRARGRVRGGAGDGARSPHAAGPGGGRGATDVILPGDLSRHRRAVLADYRSVGRSERRPRETPEARR